MTTTAQNEMTEKVIGLAMKVHGTLGPGFVEFVYRNALTHELLRAGILYETEKPLKVHYEDTVVGEFRADLVVDNWLICELKAAQCLTVEHEVQLVTYLKAVQREFGLLFNFGAKSLQHKRKYRNALSANTPADFKA